MKQPLCQRLHLTEVCLEGFDEMTSLFRILGGPVPSMQAASNPAAVVVHETDSEGGDDFEELPSFCTPLHSTGRNSARLND